MDPRFILHPTHVVDRSSARFLPPGTSFAGGHSPALLPSHLSPVQPFYTAYDQTLGVGEVAFSASVPSGQAYFRTDRLPPGTTVLQEVPNPEVGGVGYGLGPVNLGYRNVALTSLNNLQVAEIGPSAGVHSLIVPSYADVSGCGHGYGNTALVCVYQAYPQAQIHAGPALLPLSPLPSRQHMFLDQALDQEYGSLDQINPPLRARRMEVVRIRKLERGRVLDQRRELQRKPDIQKAFLKKQKAFLEKGVHASSPKGNTWCSICKVECQSAHVLQNHIEGKKHKLKLEAAKEIQGSLKKKSEDVIKEAVKSSKEKEVEVSSLAAKQQEGKAEKDGIADEAINKALLEIGKVGADFTVDRVYNELKTGDLDAEKPFKVEKVIAKIEVEADTPIGKVEGDAGATKMVILDSVQSISMDIRSKAQEDEEVFEENLRHDKIESVKVTNDINSEEDKYVAGVDLPTEEKMRHDKIESVKGTIDINSEEDKYVAGVDLPTSGKKDVLGKRSREISGLSPTATPQKTSPVKSKKANVGSSLQSEQ